MNISTLTAGLNILSAELKSPPVFDETKIELWLRVLERENVTDDEFMEICYKAITSLTFFPSLGEILRLRSFSDDERCELAWLRVLDLVASIGSFGSLCLADVGGDGAVLWTLNKLNWCEFSPSITADNLSIRRAEFVRIYKIALRAGYSDEYVRGLCEINNQLSGQDLQDLSDYALFGRPLPFPQNQQSERLALG